MDKLTEEQKKNIKNADNRTLLSWLHQLGWEHTSGLDEKYALETDLGMLVHHIN